MEEREGEGKEGRTGGREGRRKKRGETEWQLCEWNDG